jgi:kynurenine formamidase
MLVDLSMPLSPASVPVPGHPSPAFEPLHVIERDGLRNTVVTLSLHTSTHIDAPSHFIDDGATIDEIPVDRFRRPGIRLDLTRCRPGAPIGRSDLEGAGFDPSASKDAILLLASGWTDRAWTTPQLYGGNPYLALDAAEAVAAAGPSAIGLDFAVDAGRPWPNHTVLLGADVLLIENLLGIAGLPPDGFTVYAFPLRVAGENGSPARVIAELPE